MEGSGKNSIINPYQSIYRSFNKQVNEFTTREESEQVVRHLGFLYNLMGTVIKDFINILKYRLPGSENSHPSMIQDEKDDFVEVERKEVESYSNPQPPIFNTLNKKLSCELEAHKESHLEEFILKDFDVYKAGTEIKKEKDVHQPSNNRNFKGFDASNYELKQPSSSQPPTINLISAKEKEVISLDDSD